MRSGGTCLYLFDIFNFTLSRYPSEKSRHRRLLSVNGGVAQNGVWLKRGVTQKEGLYRVRVSGLILVENVFIEIILLVFQQALIHNLSSVLSPQNI